jgi:hypothetical protein
MWNRSDHVPMLNERISWLFVVFVAGGRDREPEALAECLWMFGSSSAF